MTVPAGDSAEEIFSLKELTAFLPACRSQAGNRLDFFVTFFVKKKSKRTKIHFKNVLVRQGTRLS